MTEFHTIKWPQTKYLFVEKVTKLEVTEVSTHYKKYITLGGVLRKEKFKRIKPLIKINVEIILKPKSPVGSFLIDEHGQTYLVMQSNDIDDTSFARNTRGWVQEYFLPSAPLEIIAQARFEK